MHCICRKPITGIPDTEPLFCFDLLIITLVTARKKFENSLKIVYNPEMLFSKVI